MNKKRELEFGAIIILLLALAAGFLLHSDFERSNLAEMQATLTGAVIGVAPENTVGEIAIVEPVTETSSETLPTDNLATTDLQIQADTLSFVFNDSTATHSLNSNSSTILSAVPDLRKTESKYTTDWDSNATKEFYVMINGTENKIQIFSNITDFSNYLYGVDLDGSQSSGSDMGGGHYFDILFGYLYDGVDFFGPSIWCFNQTIVEADTYVKLVDGADTSAGSFEITTANANVNQLQNYTVYWNLSNSSAGTAIELVIDVTGAWNDKLTATVIFTAENQLWYTNFTNEGPANAVPNTNQVFWNASSLTNYTNEDLNCYVNITDTDSATVYADWKLYRNNVLNQSGQTSGYASQSIIPVYTIPAANTTRSDSWVCGVKGYDGSDYEADENNATLTVRNSVPDTISVTINASTTGNYNNDDLYCYANITDLDNDAVYANYTWYKNDVLNLTGRSAALTAGVTSYLAILGRGNTSVSEKWKCQVQADDNIDGETTAFNSTNLTVNYNSVSVCGTLTASSILIADLSSNITCFTIGAHHLVLDCAGHKIYSNNSAPGTSNALIYSNFFNNLTIKNCILDQADLGIYIKTGANINITNNSVGNYLYTGGASSTAVGILLEDSVNNTHIYNNSITNITSSGHSSTSCQGIITSGTLINLTIENNRFSNIVLANGTSITSYALNLGGSNTGLIVRNNVIDQMACSTTSCLAGIGIGSTASGSGTVINNNNITNTTAGILFMNSNDYANISSNRIVNASAAFYLGYNSYSAANKIVENNQLINSTTCFCLSLASNSNLSTNELTGCGQELEVASSTTVKFLSAIDWDDVYLDAKSNVTFTNLTLGNISVSAAEFDNFNIVLSSLNTTKDVIVTNNSFFINATGSPALNRSANLTFVGVTYTSNDHYNLLKDEVNCSDCLKLGFNPARFQVISFSNYTTSSADADGDNIVDSLDRLSYNESNVTTTGITALNITIGGNSTSGTFTSGEQQINFYDGSALLVNFTYNFTAAALDLSKVRIIKATNSIIINLSGQLQSNFNKTVYLTDNSFIALCVEDAEVAAITEVSSGCTGANETSLTSCLGGNYYANGLNCTDLGTTIKIENLRHSAVRGTVTSSSSSSSSSSGGGSSSSGDTGSGIEALPVPVEEVTEETIPTE